MTNMMQKINVVLMLTVLLSFHHLFGQDQQDSILQYSMQTRWTSEVDPENVWPAYPRPQMVRSNWVNLNGYWQYTIQDKNAEQPQAYEGKILVPYPVESELSQVKRLVGENNYLWYKKNFTAPTLKSGEKLLLHFGAVDWESKVYVNGQEVGTHKGGYDPFTFDITKFIGKGAQEVVVRVWDPTDSGMQARGKQVAEPKGIWYTPVTGIWQTVWLETVPTDYVRNVKITPDIDQRKINITLQFPSLTSSASIVVKAMADGREINSKEVSVDAKSQQALVELTIPEPMLWSPDDPFLYDLQITLKNTKGNVVDEVDSYFGMRKIALGKDANGYTRIMLNNKPLFQFGLLDQGWWPDGLYTPPTEEAMLYDVKVTKDMGFNMLRKHVKVEPARFYYYCDKIGMLVWQDMPSGFNTAQKAEQHVSHDALTDWERPKASAKQFESELKAMIDHFYSFPSIVVWVPLNEGWGQYDTERLAQWVKTYDPSRLVDAPSGWADRKVGDMIDVHLYPGPGMELPEKNRASVLGEFGGLGWPVKDHLWWDKKNWGYLTYQDQETYQKEFRSIIKDLEPLVGWGLSAAIYTQTTDVEGEVNGLMTYDREVVKLDSQQVKKLIQPLYQSWWSKRMLVYDSEHDAHEWRVMFKQPKGNWKQAEYDDLQWACKKAPFSADDNPFLPASTPWKEEKLYMRKTFYLNQIPRNIFIKHYMPKSQVKVYLNGKMITELSDGGGRKRHYTHELCNEAKQYLKNGENILAVEVLSREGNGAFDMGLYTTEPVKGDESVHMGTITTGDVEK